MDALVCAIYEQRSVDPAVVDDIDIGEALREWLAAHFRSWDS